MFQRLNGYLGILLFSCLWAGTFIEAPHAPSDSGAHSEFPRLRVGTFIEAAFSVLDTGARAAFPRLQVGVFITILNMNREVARGLRSSGLETRLVSKPELFSLKHEDGLEAAPTAESSCQLAESEMTKSDARNL